MSIAFKTTRRAESFVSRLEDNCLVVPCVIHLFNQLVNSVLASRQEHLVDVTLRLFNHVDFASLDHRLAEGALVEFFDFVLKNALDLGAAIKTDASCIHACVEQIFTVSARS